MPRDSRKPNEQDILIAGAYNLGFIGLAPSDFSHEFLDWWGERLEKDCIVDPARGFFVDQRWIDLVPGLAPRLPPDQRPGFNVAYWNLPTRDLSREQRPLSGERRAAPAVPFQRVQARPPARAQLLPGPCPPRRRPRAHGALRRLRRRRSRAAGHEEASTWPYRYANSAFGPSADPRAACHLPAGRARGRRHGLAVRRGGRARVPRVVQRARDHGRRATG